MKKQTSCKQPNNLFPHKIYKPQSPVLKTGLCGFTYRQNYCHKPAALMDKSIQIQESGYIPFGYRPERSRQAHRGDLTL